MCLLPAACCRENEDGMNRDKRERSVAARRGQPAATASKILPSGDDSISYHTESTASISSLGSFDSTGSDHQHDPKRRRQHQPFRTVHFASNALVHTIDQGHDDTQKGRQELWYSRQDYLQFRQEVARKVLLESKDASSSGEGGGEGVGHALLQVYSMLRLAGYHQRYQFYHEDAELRHILSRSHGETAVGNGQVVVPDDWVGLELRAHLDMERDFRIRRAHLMDQVQRLQTSCRQELQQQSAKVSTTNCGASNEYPNYYDGFVRTNPSPTASTATHYPNYYDGFVWKDPQPSTPAASGGDGAERAYAYLICQTSRLTSHVSRLYALHVATLLAKSVAADCKEE